MRRHLIAGVTGAALAASTMLAASGVASTAPKGTVAGTPVAVPWSYEATAPQQSFNASAATTQAKQFSVIAEHAGAYGTAAPQMTAANPNLRLLGYVNGAYVQKTEGSSYPASWYLYTAGGKQVKSKGFGNYLMNVTNPAWVSTVIQHCQQVMAKYELPGCYIDMLGTASITDGYTNGVPIDPTTGQPFTSSQWLAATSSLGAQVKAALGSSVPVYANGLGNGPRYFDPTAPASQLLAGIDGALAESWLRGAHQPITWFPSEKAWLDNVNMLSDVSSRGKQMLITVKTFVPGETAAQVRAWHVYAIASYLMGADGTAAFSFLQSASADPTATDTMLNSLDLGMPTGAYAKVGGVYQRKFANGLVLVNPTKYTVTVPLGGSYTTMNGTTVTSVTMAPNDAEILTAS